MQIPKATDADKDFFRAVMPDDPRIAIKPMFGNVGAFVNGNMFAGLFGSSIGLRLAEVDLTTLAALDGAAPFGPSDRPMGGYISVPPQWRAKPTEITAWLARALDYAAALPPKPAKGKKK